MPATGSSSPAPSSSRGPAAAWSSGSPPMSLREGNPTRSVPSQSAERPLNGSSRERNSGLNSGSSPSRIGTARHPTRTLTPSWSPRRPSPWGWRSTGSGRRRGGGRWTSTRSPACSPTTADGSRAPGSTGGRSVPRAGSSDDVARDVLRDHPVAVTAVEPLPENLEGRFDGLVRIGDAPRVGALHHALDNPGDVHPLLLDDLVVPDDVDGRMGGDEGDPVHLLLPEFPALDLEDVLFSLLPARHVCRDGEGLGGRARDPEDGEDVQRLPRRDMVDDRPVLDLADEEGPVLLSRGHPITSERRAIRTGTPFLDCSKYRA